MTPLWAIVSVSIAAILAAAGVAIVGAEGATTTIAALFAFASPVIAAMMIILREVQVVSHHTNSLKDELVAEVRAASLAQGKAEGIDSERENPMSPTGGI